MYDGDSCVMLAHIQAVKHTFTQWGGGSEIRNNGMSSNNKYDYVTDTYVER